MDAGLAAVLGAAIGGGLTGLTAVGTGLFGLRTARLQLKVQESEASRQRRFESLQERRGPRSQAYAEFIEVGQELVDTLHAKDWNDYAKNYEPMQKKIRRRRAAVAIVGPDTVVQAAAQFANAVRTMRNEVQHSTTNRPWDYRRQIEGSLDDFAKAARTALEDEGHQA
ncbi:hypothetical protein ACFYXS_02940 [Streptomyces sp. NPDC002574]|uniref:hypothetical protein n=1 Tax=Streptomyces sp. NPDC002574 TaxID=3364652 RepID=UPI003680459C